MTLQPPFKLFRGVPANLLADRGTPVKIRSSKLTTCDVWQDGSTIALSLLDHSGKPVTLELPLVTLTTGNGFSVSFDFSYAACQCINGDFEEGLEKATASDAQTHGTSQISLWGGRD